MLDEYIEAQKNEIVQEICNLVNIPSVSEETKDPQMPFGEGCKKVLDYTLKLGERLGFRTKNIDNYCGYIEFGEGEKLVGIIGHLDVVPSGDGWKTPPFEASIRDGKIYGRGTIDDKGPVISALYAMKAVKDNLKVNSRVRLILGVNEEKDWKCIKHYKEKEELPSIGFSPDADFPCIYAEKGIATMYIKEDYSKYEDLPIKIAQIDCKNNAINVVPKYCKVVLKLDPDRIDVGDCFNYLSDIIRELDFDISYDTYDTDIHITSRGIQAHAAHPNLGKNAVSQMIILLNRIYKHFGYNINILDFFEKHIGMEYNGKLLDLAIEDESGILTLNVGHFKYDEDFLQIGINLRIPVNTPILEVTDSISKKSEKYDLETYVAGKQEPLYIPKDNELVKLLCNIYNKNTNSNAKPIAIGGGTYARAFDNCISFGANFPGDQDMCHQANEFVDIEKIVLACKIYAEAIYELAK
ncbi:MAG: dipeptidase PepV [Clostridia bacterium]|nr:dipeptidase PepV [Clostridia bacterium]